MPTYVFECEPCEITREELLPIAQMNRRIRCKECSKKMKRVVVATNFALLGGGWAKDGYATPKPDRYVEEQIRQNRKAQGAGDADL